MAHIVTDTVGMNRPHHVTLDLSFSSLGNDGMEKVMSSLLESQRQSGSATDHGETEATLRLSLTSRMNGLTPTAVSMILQNIMNQQSDTSATPNGGDGVVVESATTPDDQAKKESQDGESTNSTDTTSTTTTTTTKVPKLRCGVLDLGWNNFAPDQPGARRMFANLRKLVEERDACPTVLRLDRCGLGPAACRSIGKGIMNRYAKSKTDAADTTLPPTPPLSLYLCGNTDIGDGGVAAIAAGIRSCPKGTVVLDVLDLSSCGVSNTGAEALALALESNPDSVRHLILSNNDIGDDGVSSIFVALSDGMGVSGLDNSNSKKGVRSLVPMDEIVLDNNPNIGNAGASAAAKAFGKGVVRHLSLRSCAVQADGMEAFGIALKTLGGVNHSEDNPIEFHLDLSGNPIGVLHKKKKGGKYSASALKSKATATTVSYMNFIGKKVQSGLKDVGLDGIANFAATDESDDDEEARMAAGDASSSGPSFQDETDPAKARCGAKSFASSIIDHNNADNDDEGDQTTRSIGQTLMCRMGMRHTFLDQSAADAIAASITHLKQQSGLDLVIDAKLNSVLEDEMVAALKGEDDGTLEDMAERHTEAMDVLYDAEQRAAAAARAARRRHAPVMGSSTGYDEDDEEYDEDDRFGGFDHGRSRRGDRDHFSHSDYDGAADGYDDDEY